MTSRAPAQKRQTSVTSSSTTSTANPIPAAKPPCKIHPTAIIADKASLAGAHEIEIGAHCVIHPYAKIRSEGGRVVIGAYCTIAEAAVVGVLDGSSNHGGAAVLGNGVSVESAAEVLGAEVGEGTEVGVRAKIGEGAVIGKFCKIAPKLQIQPGEKLEDFTVVFGAHMRRRDGTAAAYPEIKDARMKGQERHVETLRKLIPNAIAKWTA